MTKVTIDRELLERVAQYTPSIDRQEDRARAISELRSILESTPRQPEGEWLEVVGFVRSDGALFSKSEAKELPAFVASTLDELCRLSDAKRAIAEMQAERDTLRQQLAERDADAERWRYYAPEVARRCGATLEEMNATVDAALAEVGKAR